MKFQNISLQNWFVCPTDDERCGVFVKGEKSGTKVCCNFVLFIFVCDECVGGHYDWLHCSLCKQKENKGR